MAEDAVVRRRARNGLIVLGNLAVDPLIQLLRDPTTHVRWEAAKALGSIGAPRAAPALVRVLDEDEDFDVRWLAAEALAGLGARDCGLCWRGWRQSPVRPHCRRGPTTSAIISAAGKRSIR